jgi:hypothetical protein
MNCCPQRLISIATYLLPNAPIASPTLTSKNR